jgi:hypothetical protein
VEGEERRKKSILELIEAWAKIATLVVCEQSSSESERNGSERKAVTESTTLPSLVNNSDCKETTTRQGFLQHESVQTC